MWLARRLSLALSEPDLAIAAFRALEVFDHRHTRRTSFMIRHMPALLNLPLLTNMPTTVFNPGTSIKSRPIIKARPLLPLRSPRLPPIIERRVFLSSIWLAATSFSVLG